MLTKIQKDKQLIIFDFYDTILYTEYHNVSHLRTGIADLVSKLKDEGRLLVISSDTDVSEIKRDFGYAAKQEFQANFRRIYGIDALRFDIVEGEVRKYKDLDFICNEHNISIPKAVFIGDNHQGIDEYSANRVGMDYIIVPKESKEFTFVSLLN